MAGAALSISGASLQALFKNPLVNEYILGISFGAAFGAALSLVFFGKDFPAQIAAFVFALGAVLVVLLISGRTESHTVSLLLTGVIVSAFFQALLSLVEFFANPSALQSLFFWLMGSLSLATWKDLSISLPIMAVGVVALIMMRWRLNVLSLSEEEAKSMGVHVRREKLLVILLTSMITAAATAVAGVIGWIGLIVPHLVRMMVGADNRKVIPLSAALGASVLIIADDITRVAATFEIPIGILTSLIGIPFFIILLRRSGKVWL
jgi:iron complex transport system permease protein